MSESDENSTRVVDLDPGPSRRSSPRNQGRLLLQERVNISQEPLPAECSVRCRARHHGKVLFLLSASLRDFDMKLPVGGWLSRATGKSKQLQTPKSTQTMNHRRVCRQGVVYISEYSEATENILTLEEKTSGYTQALARSCRRWQLRPCIGHMDEDCVNGGRTRESHRIRKDVRIK